MRLKKHASSVAAIIGCDGAPVGSGIVIDRSRVLTCAHVIEEVLGRRVDAAHVPDDQIELSVPIREGGKRSVFSAVVQPDGWFPPSNDPQYGHLEDLAVLALVQPREFPASVSVATFPIKDTDASSGVVVTMIGFPSGGASITIEGRTMGQNDSGRIEIDPHQGGHAVSSGFSGAGIYDVETSETLGMIVSKRTYEGRIRALATPAATIAKHVTLTKSTASFSSEDPIKIIADYLLDSATPDRYAIVEDIVSNALIALTKANEEIDDEDAVDILRLHHEIQTDLDKGFIERASTASEARAAIDLIDLIILRSSATAVTNIDAPLDERMRCDFAAVQTMLSKFLPSVDNQIGILDPATHRPLTRLDDILTNALADNYVSLGIMSKSADNARKALRDQFDTGFRRLCTSISKSIDHRMSGTIFLDQETLSQMIVVPVGLDFDMGYFSSNNMSAKNSTNIKDASPRQKINIKKPFAIGKYTVTQSQFADFCRETGRGMEVNRYSTDNFPAVNLTWFDASEYCDWVSARTGARYRLPSEAEWEYCCRALSLDSFSFGGILSPTEAHHHTDYVEEEVSRQGAPVPVDHPGFRSNKFGIHQMLGNVWEWCLDDFVAGYDDHPGQEPRMLAHDSADKVMRGGSWNDPPSMLRPWYRQSTSPETRSPIVGFRLLREIPW